MSNNPFGSRPDSHASESTLSDRTSGDWEHSTDLHGGVLPPRYTELFAARQAVAGASSSSSGGAMEKSTSGGLGGMPTTIEEANEYYDTDSGVRAQKLIPLEEAQKRFGAGARRLVTPTMPAVSARSEVGSLHAGRSEVGSIHAAAMMESQPTGSSGSSTFVSLGDLTGKKDKGRKIIGNPKPILKQSSRYEEPLSSTSSKPKFTLPKLPPPPLDLNRTTTFPGAQYSPPSSINTADPPLGSQYSPPSSIHTTDRRLMNDFHSMGFDSYFDAPSQHQPPFLTVPTQLGSGNRVASSVYSEFNHNPFLRRTEYDQDVLRPQTGTSYAGDGQRRRDSYETVLTSPSVVQRPVGFSSGIGDDEMRVFKPVGIDRYPTTSTNREAEKLRKHAPSEYDSGRGGSVIYVDGGYITDHQANRPDAFTMNEKREANIKKVERKKRWRNRCLMICGLRWKWWCIGLALILIGGGIAAGVIFGRKLNKKPPPRVVTHDEMFYQVDGFPDLPKVATVMRIAEKPAKLDACVNPNALWTCELPPELRASEFADGQELGGLAINFKFKDEETMKNPSKEVLFTPSPNNPPGDEDYESVRDMDGMQSDGTGEITNFVASIQFPTAKKDQQHLLSRRQIPSAHQNPASVFPPVINNQPLRLFDRGLPTEHYGFHAFFQKSIYLPDIEGKSGKGDVEIPPGGIAGTEAKFVCTFTRTRFTFKIFTRQGDVKVNRSDKTLTSSTAIKEFLSPMPEFGEENPLAKFKDMPYPVTVAEDRGGDLAAAGRSVQCYKLLPTGQVVISDRRPVLEFKIPQSKRGCICEWKNWS